MVGSLPRTGQAIVSTLAGHTSTTATGLTHAGESGGSDGMTCNAAQSDGRRGEAVRRLEDMDYLTASTWVMSRIADGLAYAT